jgi:hypothetical protein
MLHEAGGGRLLNYPAAHVFRPPRGAGVAIGAGVAAAAAVLGLISLIHGFLTPVSFAAFGSDLFGVVLLAGGALAAYWTYALYDLHYVVEDDALVIVWGLTRQTIPVEQIERIVLGKKYGEPKLDGIRWPGYCVGRGRVPRLGEAIYYSAHRTPADLVYVSTPAETYGLSLTDARGLARTIQAAQEAGGNREEMPTASHTALSLQALLLDRPALALAGAALLAFLVAFGYIFSRYPALPASLSLPYPPANGAERIGQRNELVRLALTALLWLIVGFGLAAWAHSRLRAIAYTLLAGTLFAECLYVIAALAAAH